MFDVTGYFRQQLQTGQNWLYNAANTVKDFADLTAWYNKAQDSYNKLTRAMADAAKLHNETKSNPGLAAEYQKALGLAQPLVTLFGTIKSGYEGVQKLFRAAGLGAVPVIPIAVIASIVYFLDKVANSALPAMTGYITRAQVYKMQVQSGVSPTVAATVAEQEAREARDATIEQMGMSLSSLASSTTSKLMIAAVAAAIIFMYVNRK